MSALRNKIPQVDTHTHTILSGHAWGTLRENVQAAAERGLKGICLTEHGPAIPGGVAEFVPAAQVLLPEVIQGVRIYKGVELSILDAAGHLDIPDRYLSELDFVIASNHVLAASFPDERAVTDGYCSAICDPYVDMIGHFHDIRTRSDYRKVIATCAENGKLLELNGSYMAESRKEHWTYLRDCVQEIMRQKARVCVSSDAHYPDHIGAVGNMMAFLDDMDFPEEQIVNLTIEGFQSYLKERKARMEGLA